MKSLQTATHSGINFDLYDIHIYIIISCVISDILVSFFISIGGNISIRQVLYTYVI